MPDPVPPLTAKRPGPGLRLAGLVVPGVRQVTAQIEPYTRWWHEENQRAARTAGPLLVAIGDSTAIGIGASRPELGYVGIIGRALDAEAGNRGRWRTVNLAQSGARVDDGLDRQLPALADLRPDVVLCCIGTNDLVWGRQTTALGRRLTELVNRLPACSVVGTLAGGSVRARLANRALREATAEVGLPLVVPWGEPGPGARSRLAADRFHPNDLGYELMSRPFRRQLGLDAPHPDPSVPDGEPTER